MDVPRSSLRTTAVALASLVVVHGCDFSAPVDVPVPAYEARLVVGGFVLAGAPVEVRFGVSRPATSRNQGLDSYLGPGVRAVLYVDGRPADTLRYADPRPGSVYPRYVSAVRAEAGARYELRASYEGLPPVRAETTVPHPVPVTLSRADPVGGELRSVTVSWTDPPGPNTYGLTARLLNNGTPLPFLSADPDLRESYEGLGRPVAVDPEQGAGPPGFGGEAFLTDSGFEGRAKTVTLLLLPAGPEGNAELTLSALSDEFVRYMAALRVQEATSEDPFVEPTQAVTNVEGGLGVFAGYAESSVRL